MNGGPTSIAVHDKLHTAEVTLHLADARDRPGRIQHAGRDLINVFLLSDREDLAIGLLEGCFYSAQRRGTARTDGRGDTGKQDGIAQRQYGESHPVGHGFSILGINDDIPGRRMHRLCHEKTPLQADAFRNTPPKRRGHGIRLPSRRGKRAKSKLLNWLQRRQVAAKSYPRMDRESA